MSNKKKKTASEKSGNKPKKTDTKGLKQEKVESINLKALARDERTWKIIGAVSLLIAIFLFIAFISYFFTWSKTRMWYPEAVPFFLIIRVRVNNLLGKLGALVSHFFIFKAFGIASLLICTFFFVAGVNLLFSRKVFSIWKNLKYVTIGLLLLSVSLAFILSGSEFRFGGGVGEMISNWLVGIFGNYRNSSFIICYWHWDILSGNSIQVLICLQKERLVSLLAAGDTVTSNEDNEKLFIETKGNSLKSNGSMIPLTRWKKNHCMILK